MLKTGNNHFALTLSTMHGAQGGLFARGCHGLIIENCGVNIYCNVPQKNCPTGIAMHGGNSACAIKNCEISGNPSVGIKIVPDRLNGTNSAIAIDHCQVSSATKQGILLSGAIDCSILNSVVSGGQNDGVVLEKSSNCSIRDNTITNNKGIGIKNIKSSNQIYHNFAAGNGINYQGVNPALITVPGPHVGVLENING